MIKQFVFLLLLFSVVGFAGDMKALKIGEQVPLFALKNYDGKEYSLKNILKENKYTVIMYISTECPVSNAYNERMAELHETFSDKGVTFVGVNSNKEENEKQIAEHSKEHNFSFPVLKDDQSKIADLYAAQVTPEVFVVNSKGELMYHGRIDDNKNPAKIKTHDLTVALDTLLEGKELSVTEAKAFGCTIKRIVID